MSVYQSGFENNKVRELDNKKVQTAQLKDNRTVLQKYSGLQTSLDHSAKVIQQKEKADAISNSTVQRVENNTGLPDQLKSGIESLSGIDMSDTRVHYNSSAPAQLQAHAFAQGNNIHIAPGQEQHLPHEAWHVVQQKQGRVNATKQLKGKTAINDDAGLEREADIMGAKAMQGGIREVTSLKKISASGPIQRKIGFEFEESSWEVYQGIEQAQEVQQPQEQIVEENQGQQQADEIKKIRISGKQQEEWPEFVQAYMSKVSKFESLRDKIKGNTFDTLPEALKFIEETIDSADGKLSFYEQYTAIFQDNAEAHDQFKSLAHLDESAGIKDYLFHILKNSVNVGDYYFPLTEDGQIAVFKSMLKEDDPNHIDKTMVDHGVKAAPKVWNIHQGTNYSLETDGPYDNGKMDLEIVTKPFPMTDAGYRTMVNTYRAIEQTVISKLRLYGGKKNASIGEFVGPDQHGFDNQNAFLAGGKGTPTFKMQVTHGVNLADIPTLMKYFGAAEDNEGHFDKGRRKNARKLVYGTENPRKTESTHLKRSPSLAKEAIASLKEDHIFDADADTKALEGFIAYMLMYIQGLANTPLKGIKEFIPFLSRFSMDTLFEKLPDAQKNPLKVQAGKLALVKAIDKVIPKDTLKNEVPDEDGQRVNRPMMRVRPYQAQVGNPEKVQFYKHIRQMTVKDWVLGICDGVDFLTKEGIMQYFHDRDIDASRYEKAFKIFVRGHADTSNVVQAENQQENLLAVMENRFIKPQGHEDGMTFEAVRSAAKSYFKFIQAVNNLNGAYSRHSFKKVNHME